MFEVGCRLQERSQSSEKIWDLLIQGCETNLLAVPSTHNQCTKKETQTKLGVEPGSWKEGL